MTQSFVYRRKASVVACELDGGSVLLDLDSSRYFGLNGVGLFVWDLMAEPRTAVELCDRVRESFDVPDDRCRSDIDSLIEQLLNRQLVERESASLAQA